MTSELHSLLPSKVNSQEPSLQQSAVQSFSAARQNKDNLADSASTRFSKDNAEGAKNGQAENQAEIKFKLITNNTRLPPHQAHFTSQFNEVVQQRLSSLEPQDNEIAGPVMAGSMPSHL